MEKEHSKNSQGVTKYLADLTKQGRIMLCVATIRKTLGRYPILHILVINILMILLSITILQCQEYCLMFFRGVGGQERYIENTD